MPPRLDDYFVAECPGGALFRRKLMFKIGFGVIELATLTLSTLIASAEAQTRKNRNYYGDNYYYSDNYRRYGNAQRQVRGRYDRNSLDGRRTGQPRTCGHDFFQYDGFGVPYGPYCN